MVWNKWKSFSFFILLFISINIVLFCFLFFFAIKSYKTSVYQHFSNYFHVYCSEFKDFPVLPTQKYLFMVLITFVLCLIIFLLISLIESEKETIFIIKFNSIKLNSIRKKVWLKK